MSQWKTKFRENLHEAGISFDSKEFADVRAAENPIQFWIELWLIFEKAHERNDANLIKLIYQHAFWCLEHGADRSDAQHDPKTAAWVAFFEHLPLSLAVSKRMTEFMSLKQLDEISEAFQHHLGKSVCQKLMNELRRQYKASALP